MIKLRKLTAKESQKFQNLCRKDNLLNSNLDVKNFTSGEILTHTEVDPDKKFNNKLELGAYLYEKLGNALVDNDVWHFLVIIYHKQLLKNGKIGEIDRFYINPQKKYYPFTHLLKPVFDLYSFYCDKKELIDFLLLKPVNEGGGDIFLETVKRRHMMRNEHFIQVIKVLFYDGDHQKIKAGIKYPIRRLVALWQQYERTYDLYSMPAEKILKNLISKHKEFARYKT